MSAARRITPIIALAMLLAVAIFADTTVARSKPRHRARCTIKGTSGDDHLVDSGGGNKICALGGNDIVEAGPGADTVYGARGDDRLEGNEGNDGIFGGKGADTLVSSDGVSRNDRVFGGPGRDTCIIDRGDRVQGCESKRIVG
jgi:Ca2+-binding RTX toxin-like protein